MRPRRLLVLAPLLAPLLGAGCGGEAGVTSGGDAGARVVLAGVDEEALSFTLADGTRLEVRFDELGCRDAARACAARFRPGAERPAVVCRLEGGTLSCRLESASGVSGRLEVSPDRGFEARLSSPSGTLELAGRVERGGARGRFAFAGAGDCPCIADGTFAATR